MEKTEAPEVGRAGLIPMTRGTELWRQMSNGAGGRIEAGAWFGMVPGGHREKSIRMFAFSFNYFGQCGILNFSNWIHARVGFRIEPWL